MILILLAIAPAIIIILYIYHRDKFDKEPPLLLFLSFMLGVLSVVPPLLVGLFADKVGIYPEDNLITLAFHTFIVVALAEEGGKFLFLRGVLFKRKEFNEPLDGIVYATMIGMGFATFENIFYVIEGGIGVAIMRMLTAVPAHAAFAIIMGYYVGRAKFEPEHQNQLLIKGLLIPVIAHGLYDFFLMQNYQESAMVIALIVLAIALKFSQLAIKEHQKTSELDTAKHQNETALVTNPNLNTDTEIIDNNNSNAPTLYSLPSSQPPITPPQNTTNNTTFETPIKNTSDLSTEKISNKNPWNDIFNDNINKP